MLIIFSLTKSTSGNVDDILSDRIELMSVNMRRIESMCLNMNTKTNTVKLSSFVAVNGMMKKRRQKTITFF